MRANRLHEVVRPSDGNLIPHSGRASARVKRASGLIVALSRAAFAFSKAVKRARAQGAFAYTQEAVARPVPLFSRRKTQIFTLVVSVISVARVSSAVELTAPLLVAAPAVIRQEVGAVSERKIAYNPPVSATASTSAVAQPSALRRTFATAVALAARV